MVCCFAPVQKLYSKSLATPDISAPRSVSQRAAYLESEAPASSSCPLRCSRRRTLARSHPLDSISPALLSPHSRAPAGVSRQVRRRSQVGLSTWPTAPFRGFGAARATQILRRLAATAVSQKLGGLLQATLRRPRVCAPVSRSLHSPCRHLQPSTGLVGRRPSHLSLAGLGGPQS